MRLPDHEYICSCVKPRLHVVALGLDGESRGLELANGQAVIDKNSDWLSITHDDNLIHDFDEEERELLRPLLVGPRMFLIEYKGTRLADLLIQSIPVDCDAMIDNDHGLLIRAHLLQAFSIVDWGRARILP